MKKSYKKISWLTMLRTMEDLGYDYTGEYSFIPKGYKQKQMLFRFDTKCGRPIHTSTEIKDLFKGQVTIFNASPEYAPEQHHILMTNQIFTEAVS